MSTQDPLHGDALELADVFEQYGPAYINKYGDRMPTRHKKVMRDIMRCRTPELGGHIYECEPCHQIAYSYHSCQPVPPSRGIAIVPNAETTMLRNG